MVARVTLTNTEAWITDCDDKTYEFLREYWSYYPPGYRFSPKHAIWLRAYARDKRKVDFDPSKLPGWDGKIKLFKRGSVPAGLFRATLNELEEKHGVKFNLSYDLPKALQFQLGLPRSKEKYRYQEECVDEMCMAVTRGGGIVLSATGSGKTATAARFFARVSCNCLFVVDQLDLLHQSQEEIQQWLGEPVGLVGASQFQLQRVTVATIQTLRLHLSDFRMKVWYRSIQIMVVDELHEQINRSNFELLETIKPIARYGLTATLSLGKKHQRLRAYAFAGPVIFKFPLSEGVKAGVLSEGKAVQLLFPEGDFISNYQTHYSDEVVNNGVKEAACRLIVDYLRQQKRYVIVLGERVRHVKRLYSAMDGIPRRLAYGAVDKTTRKLYRSKFEEGKVRLLIANKIFKKGINIKRVDCIIDMAEMKSKNDTQQKYGRGVRLHPDKDSLLYVDVATQGKERFGKAAASRARAIRQLGVSIQRVKVNSPEQALEAIKRALQSTSQMKLELSA